MGFFGGRERGDKGGSFREGIGRNRRSSRDFVGSEATRMGMVVLLKGFVRSVRVMRGLVGFSRGSNGAMRWCRGGHF